VELNYIYQTRRFELPNPLHINQTMPGDKNETYITNLDGQTMAASTYLPLVEPTSHGPDIMRLTVLNGTTWCGNMTTSASQCSLYWCAKTLEAEVVNGRFSEHELDTGTTKMPNPSLKTDRGCFKHYDPVHGLDEYFNLPM
jgi:hypothetical protein